jgi:hypothetical protein
MDSRLMVNFGPSMLSLAPSLASASAAALILATET